MIRYAELFAFKVGLLEKFFVSLSIKFRNINKDKSYLHILCYLSSTRYLQLIFYSDVSDIMFSDINFRTFFVISDNFEQFFSTP